MRTKSPAKAPKDRTSASPSELRRRVNTLERENRRLRELAAVESVRQRQSEANFRGYFENVGVGAAQIDLQARFIRVNDRFCAITGYSREELLGGMKPLDLDHPEDRKADRAKIARLLKGEGYEMEKRYLSKDGRVVWVHITVTPILDGSGQFIRSAAVVEDITPRKQAEFALKELNEALECRVTERTTALRESEARLQQAAEERERHLVQLEAVLNHLTEGLVIADPHGKMLHWNPAALKIHGFSSDAEWQRQLADFDRYFELTTGDGHLLAPDQWPLARILRGEVVHGCELLVRRKDRKEWHRFLSYGGALARDADDCPLLAVLTITDITHRKRAEAALRANVERLRQGVRAAGLGVFHHDHRTGEIYYSRTLRDIYGWSHTANFTLAEIIESVHPQDQAMLGAAIQRAHNPAGNGRFAVEHRIIRPDGTIRWVSTRSQTTFEGKGAARHPVRTVGALVDITERKEAEAALRSVLRNARTITMHATVTAPAGWDQHPPEWSALRFRWESTFDDEQACQEVLPVQLKPGEDYTYGWGRAKHRDDQESMSLVAARAFVSGASHWRQEFRAIDRHGRVHWFTQAASLETVSPGCWRVTTINTDITERKEAEENLQRARDELEQRVAERTAELAQSNQRLTKENAERLLAEQAIRRQAELLDMASDAIIIRDFDGTIRYWNRGAERLYGFSFAEAKGKSIHKLLSTVFPKGLELFQSTLVKESVWSGEITQTTKSGRRVVVESHQQLVKQPDSSVLVLTTNHDITERVSLHDEIVSAGERERERIGQNLHDGLCQLLTAARLKADSLATRLADQEPTHVRSLKSVATLIAQAVDEAQGLARGLEPVEHLPEGLMSALQQLAANTSRLFNVNCTCEFPQPVFVEDHRVATELFRIAQEAVNNAIKHSQAGSIRIRLAPEAGAGVLSVTCDGSPFPKHPRASGMGLKTMHFRAGRIGAALEIKRGPRKGAIVRCALPIAPNFSPSSASANNIPPQGATL